MNESDGRFMFAPRRDARFGRGVTLIELMIALVIIVVLASIALPSYREYIKRNSRSAVQAELVELAGIQERIYLNTNAYTANLEKPYTGDTNGGLGVSSGLSRDSRYTLSVSVSGSSYSLKATPVAQSTQDGDGIITLSSNGSRTWGNKSW